MSEPLLPLVVAAAVGTSTPPPPQIAPVAEVHLNDVSVALPSLDGLRGLQVQYERFVPARRLGLAVSGQFRETAIGDYTSLRLGVGAEARIYWRPDAWLSRQPAGSMVGWFVGARVDAVIERTHDDVSDRSLGSTLELGFAARVGYRIAPWRDLEITPSLALTQRVDLPLSGRLPPWTRTGVAGGLSLGWLY